MPAYINGSPQKPIKYSKNFQNFFTNCQGNTTNSKISFEKFTIDTIDAKIGDFTVCEQSQLT